MKADLSIYISFDGQAREALTRYHTVFGGDLELETYGTWGLARDPADADRVVYGVLRSPEGFVLRATDRPLQPGPIERGTAFAVCVNGEERDLLTARWEALAVGSQVIQPLAETPWGDLNGCLQDPYGVLWVFNIGSSA